MLPNLKNPNRRLYILLCFRQSDGVSRFVSPHRNGLAESRLARFNQSVSKEAALA